MNVVTGIPTHRNARETRGDFLNKIKEYMGQYQSGGSNAPTSSGASPEATNGSQQGQEGTYTPQTETSSGSEQAASEPEPSFAAKDSSSTSSSSAGGFSNPFNSYIPAQYQNQFNPNQFSQCSGQFGQYIPTNAAGSSSSSPGAASTTSTSP